MALQTKTPAADAHEASLVMMPAQQSRLRPETMTQLTRRATVLRQSLGAHSPHHAKLTRAKLVQGAVVLDTSAALARAVDQAGARGDIALIIRGLRTLNTSSAFRRISGLFYERGAQGALVALHKTADFGLHERLTKEIFDAGTKSSRKLNAELKHLKDPRTLGSMVCARWTPMSEDELATAAKAVVIRETLDRTEARISTIGAALSTFAERNEGHPAVVTFGADGDVDKLQKTVLDIAATYSAKLHVQALAAAPARPTSLSELL